MANQEATLVNLEHLEHLTETTVFQGVRVGIVHVYANAPSYEWTEANDSSPEGVACVDDAARAAIFYLRHYELTKTSESLEKAKSLLRFVTKMQSDDGQFYNFIFADHSINRDGRTSYKSFGWWGERAFWAMSAGYRILKNEDPAFATELNAKLQRSFRWIDSLLESYDSFEQRGSQRIPKWIIHQYGEYSASATSELLIGLCEYYAAEPNAKVKAYVEKFAEALIAMQVDGVFLSEGAHWHAWANCQTQALVTAGRLLDRKDWIQAAEKEVQSFYSRLLVEDFRREFEINDANSISNFSQTAYGFRPMIVGALRLAEATGNQDYEKMAGLIASWFFGNNPAGKQMYERENGRCFDGLDSSSVNFNSGAESTIEALYSIIEVEQHPIARKYLFHRKKETGETNGSKYAVFRNDQGEQVTLVLNSKKDDLAILEKNT
ncbi:MAG TPA: glycoside hydrolase family 9 protein [Candidatus Norongarragalinales archaeon]|jgi:hypothetical protein|nr:glycoside hydrolase family 9 protein [Candidatus Norongarragalinales archaeon]